MLWKLCFWCVVFWIYQRRTCVQNYLQRLRFNTTDSLPKSTFLRKKLKPIPAIWASGFLISPQLLSVLTIGLHYVNYADYMYTESSNYSRKSSMTIWAFQLLSALHHKWRDEESVTVAYNLRKHDHISDFSWSFIWAKINVFLLDLFLNSLLEKILMGLPVNTSANI